MSELVLRIALLVAVLILPGCAFPRLGWDRPDAWRAEAEKQCLASKQVVRSRHVTKGRRLRGPGPCGTRRPYTVTAFAGGAIELSTEGTLACPMIPAIERWLAFSVQPAALQHLGARVTGVQVLSTYSCRKRNNGKRSGKWSEHAFANAIDIASFTLEDGRSVSVESGWNGSFDEAGFLRAAHNGACSEFTTVIGPAGDSYHRNHFHLDLARHNAANSYRYCR